MKASNDVVTNGKIDKSEGTKENATRGYPTFVGIGSCEPGKTAAGRKEEHD